MKPVRADFYRELLEDVGNSAAQFVVNAGELKNNYDRLDNIVGDLRNRVKTFSPAQKKDGVGAVDRSVDVSDPSEHLAVIRERLHRTIPDLDNALLILKAQRDRVAAMSAGR